VATRGPGGLPFVNAASAALARGPEIRMTATPARPAALVKAKIVSRE